MKRFLFVVLTLLVALCFAHPSLGVTQLHVKRSADNSLWKMTCEGLVCGAWTLIQGKFGSAPTLTWDASIRRYILTGIGPNGATIWRSTFDESGNWMNDWVRLPDTSPSSIASASNGVLAAPAVSLTETPALFAAQGVCQNFLSVSVSAVAGSRVTVDADVIVRAFHADNLSADLVHFYIGTTPTECACAPQPCLSQTSAEFQVSPGESAGDFFSATLHLQRTLPAAAGVSTFYLNGIWTSGFNSQNESVQRAGMKAVLYP